MCAKAVLTHLKPLGLMPGVNTGLGIPTLANQGIAQAATPKVVIATKAATMQQANARFEVKEKKRLEK